MPPNLIEAAIHEAFEIDGDPIKNLIMAALDDRRLHKAIGSPLKERCATIIRRARVKKADSRKRTLVVTRLADETIKLLGGRIFLGRKKSPE
jgi:hypothetical protein